VCYYIDRGKPPGEPGEEPEMRLVNGNRQVRQDAQTPKARVELKQRVCRHGWEIPQELVTLTITDRRTGNKQFRQVWRDVEHAACPDA
jgi:hypothetical protein